MKMIKASDATEFTDGGGGNSVRANSFLQLIFDDDDDDYSTKLQHGGYKNYFRHGRAKRS
jgi:hypothetical protein